VLVPSPYWTTYPEAISLAGGVAVPITTSALDGFRVTVDQLDTATSDRTKALLFVSPSNPTGAVYPPHEIEAIGRWASERGIWVVTDEIYEHLTYGGHEFASMPALVPELADRCVILNGVAKTYAMTGWRVGWLIAPADVATAATNLQSHSTSNVSNIAQRAALAAVEGDLAAVAEMRAAFDRRGRLMHGMLSAIDGVTCLEPQGAFYCFPSFEGVLGREVAGRRVETSLELCEVLLDAAKVAIVPGEAFGAPSYARLSFALGDDDLGEGVRRIAGLLAAG
jgi:aspartate/methionine/tyrosine aminotransferase